MGAIQHLDSSVGLLALIWIALLILTMVTYHRRRLNKIEKDVNKLLHENEEHKKQIREAKEKGGYKDGTSGRSS